MTQDQRKRIISDYKNDRNNGIKLKFEKSHSDIFLISPPSKFNLYIKFNKKIK